MNIHTPEDQARIWLDTLRVIDDAGLLDTIIYVDLCNEYPLPFWAPYLRAEDLGPEPSKTEPRLIEWMRDSIAILRSHYPHLDYTFSFNSEFERWPDLDVSMLDVLEPHVWMATTDNDRFNERVGYHFEKFDPIGFDHLVKNGRAEYENNRAEYDRLLFEQIDRVADWSRATGLGLYTTECWSIVDYKDWPGLDWDWVLDLNARAVEYAASKGRWVGIATSNFCGPQFAGMWREVEWHQRLTTLIKSAPVDSDLSRTRTFRGSEPVNPTPSATVPTLGKDLRHDI
ncbi:hypothetical protein GCM10025867_04030 [Frondihabitans sucicola]|uniref:Uncharacterized protein n=1 Tax=Frondihabitans sucicola TaxID=1268041 RepID=A0ABM8GIE8_9MICO|nr:hypothetical protein GCM10025867_04030 [Frondihabitans sucicola]